MSSRPLLEGHVHQDESVNLKRIIVGLEQELEEVREALKDEKMASVNAKRALKRFQTQFKPMYDSLRGLFEDLDEIGGDPVAGAAPSGLSARWEMLKSRLGGRQAEFIDILKHGEMSAAQVRAAAKCDIKTAYKVLQQMRNAGFVNKNGGKFSLKET